MSSPLVEIRIVVPRQLWEELERVSRKLRMPTDRLIIAALELVLEDYKRVFERA